jgi:hypothetical protein
VLIRRFSDAADELAGARMIAIIDTVCRDYGMP